MTMDIVLDSLLEGARRATGAVAVIDVLRAFTTAAVALANGAERIIMVTGADEALSLRDRGVGDICMGEVDGRPPPGFDFGNSPYELSRADLHGKTVIQRSSAGTQGMVATALASQRYAASLVTATATACALRAASSQRISLVAMGKDADSRTDEDELCAMHIRNVLQGRPGDLESIRRLILAGGEAPRFGDPKRPWLHREDLDIALDIDRYDFAIRVDIQNGRPVASRQQPVAG
ncbi:MAG TPA: 2-phosphosulfolactate phosphatase [Acetobacteraceae bacterium]|nr:2-phosphosulfolactate phosphatase [Acetobacteraceae bacterium]